MDDKEFILDQLVNATEHCDAPEMVETLSQVDGFRIQDLVNEWYESGHTAYVRIWAKEGLLDAEAFVDEFVDKFKETK